MREDVIWKDVVGYEGLYKVSSDGHIRNVKTDKIQAKSLMAYRYYKADLNAESTTYGWLYTKHPDGQWVTLRKLGPDEIEIAHDQAADGAVLQGTKVRAG